MTATKRHPLKKMLPRNLNLGDQALLGSVDPDKIERNLHNLFKEKTLTDIFGEPEDVMEGAIKKKAGRPKKVNKSTRYKEGRLKEVMDDYEKERVVPMYDGFDPLNGGMTMLTPMEHRFVIAYAQTGNAARSAEMASLNDGSKRKSPQNWKKYGAELLKRQQVRVAIGQQQKKICIAAALDSTEVISNIREISALSMIDGKYEAALKANLMLGEYLGIFGKTQAERMKNITHETTVEVFKSGEDLIDNKNDIKKLSNQLGLDFKSKI